MSTIRNFEDLEIWQKARAVCKHVYLVTKGEDFAKDFRFKDQIRSSAGSCMDNIAEGFEREGNKEFLQFLSIAKASIGETRSQITRAYDVGYVKDSDYNQIKEQCIILRKSISGFIKYLKNSDIKGNKFQESETDYSVENNLKSQNSNLK